MSNIYSKENAVHVQEQCRTLLKEWCDAMLRLQIKDTGNSKLDGALICPACGKIHGRCFEAMYPFLCMASLENDTKWIRAAENLFIWAENTVSQEDGSFRNDIDSGWKGTTVFNVIQLADCLLFHGDLLSKKTKSLWTRRLADAADFLYHFNALERNNINYPISNALALYECSLILHEEHYRQKAAELAEPSKLPVSQNGLVYGEGVPRDKMSSRGCRPIDIGYNVEETLPSLALYGNLTQNQKVLDAAKDGFSAHLLFLLENGAWDNSFGTRNYKWSYWGSRTSDGCALGYLLFADQDPDFGLAAIRNLNLLKKCTVNGLLAGGPHYAVAGQSPCIHHTFTHAKVLAGIMDRAEDISELKLPADKRLPRQRTEGIRYYPELESWILTKGSMTATATAYDWEYLSGGHVGGGTLSLLQHEKLGPLLCAGMSRYTLKEPNNMQVSANICHECLALRIVNESDGILYSSIYDDNVQMDTKGTLLTAHGTLNDSMHHTPSQCGMHYSFAYQLFDQELCICAKCHQGTLICPIVSNCEEPVTLSPTQKQLTIHKKEGTLVIESSHTIHLPYGTNRIFNLVPGMQALKLELAMQNELEITLKIRSV